MGPLKSPTLLLLRRDPRICRYAHTTWAMALFSNPPSLAIQGGLGCDFAGFCLPDFVFLHPCMGAATPRASLAHGALRLPSPHHVSGGSGQALPRSCAVMHPRGLRRASAPGMGGLR